MSADFIVVDGVEHPIPDKVKVRWYCGRYYGPPIWHGTETYEPDECGTEFETEEDLDAWIDGSVTAVCPKCGSKLDVEFDCPVLAEE